MRAPRYRFPEEVRSATRVMASRMVKRGDFARSPAELEAWISTAPDVEARLREGGYGTHFDAADLLPLLEAALTRAGAGAPAAEASGSGAGRGWIAALVLAAAAAAVITWVVVRGF